MSLIALLSESSEESEDESGPILRLKRHRRHIRDISNPLDLDEFCFIRNFRLTKMAFIDLLEEVDTKLKPAIRTSAIPSVIKLASVLRFLAQGSYQASVGNDFNVGLAQPTISLVFKEVINIFEQYICPKWIKFNYSEEEKNQAKLHFYEKSGLPGIIGAIDGTHIRIRTPLKNRQHLYYNRKGFFSLNAMIVCDHNQIIRYVNAKHPGATHDSLVWDLSALKSKLMDDFQRGERTSWLIGDAGYPLAPYLITPFRNVDDNSLEARFNSKHTQARLIIERTIGVFKNRFRCVLGARELHYTPEKATQIINVCAALHNICVKYKIPFNENYQLDDDDDDIDVEAVETDINYQSGVSIRQAILSSLVL